MPYILIISENDDIEGQSLTENLNEIYVFYFPLFPTFQPARGYTGRKCLPCEPGTFNPSKGRPKCQPCPANFYQVNVCTTLLRYIIHNSFPRKIPLENVCKIAYQWLDNTYGFSDIKLKCIGSVYICSRRGAANSKTRALMGHWEQTIMGGAR